MCQLLGMNSAEPSDFRFSFSGFAQRGGESDHHSDGWGLAIYQGRGLQSFVDHTPAAWSPIAALISSHPIKTHNMLAHIRYATKGTVALENVHPFSREMWGIQWSFAHNGDVPRFAKEHAEDVPRLGGRARTTTTTKTAGEEKDGDGDDVDDAGLSFHPVGETDSEAIFCALLNALKAEFRVLPTLDVLYDTIKRLCCEIVADDEGVICNFLLGCGQYTQFAFSWPGARPGSKVWNGLHYTLRRPPFTTVRLADDCGRTIDFSKVNRPTDRMAVITTKPLTVDERWVEMSRGELIMFDKGVPYSVACDCVKVEEEGRGLSSRVLPRRRQCAGGRTDDVAGTGRSGTKSLSPTIRLSKEILSASLPMAKI